MTTTATPPATKPAARPSLAEQRERHRRSRRRALRAFFALLLVALVGTAVWLVYFSSVLDTRTVVVSGTRELTRDQVTQAAAVPLGTPLARQQLDAAARRATSLPQVSAAEVTREWPHTVHVAVTERVPLLAVAQPGGFLVVDKAGVVFAAKTTRPAGVVEVAADPADRPLLVELGAVVLALPDDVRGPGRQHQRGHPGLHHAEDDLRRHDRLGRRVPDAPQGPGRRRAPRLRRQDLDRRLRPARPRRPLTLPAAHLRP